MADDRTRDTGFWKSWKNLEKQIVQLIGELGHFPSQNELLRMGRRDVYRAIKRYHGGFLAVRERMGHALPQKPPGWWDTWSNLEKELRAIADGLSRFPKSAELLKIGRSDVLNALRKHGGLKNVREKMGYRNQPAMPLSDVLSKHELSRLYEVERISEEKIAKLKRVNRKTVRRYLGLYGIKTRRYREQSR